MLTLSQLCPGVEPTTDSLVYLVQSGSRAKIKHRVDLTSFDGWGACGCENFLIRMAPLLNAGEDPNENLECKHIVAAKKYLAAEVAQQIIRSKANGKKSNHESPPF